MDKCMRCIWSPEMSFIRHWIEQHHFRSKKQKTEECRDEKHIYNYRAIALGNSKDGQNKRRCWREKEIDRPKERSVCVCFDAVWLICHHTCILHMVRSAEYSQQWAIHFWKSHFQNIGLFISSACLLFYFLSFFFVNWIFETHTIPHALKSRTQVHMFIFSPRAVCACFLLYVFQSLFSSFCCCLLYISHWPAITT